MSDHFSGPRALAGPAGDICDLYAFPSPDRPGRLVLVMTVLPRASATALFSDAVGCRFRLRPLAVAGSGFAVGPEELVVDIEFDAPRPGPVQEGRCTVGDGDPVAVTVHDAKGGSGGGVRVFAGLRSDPFFLDLPAMQRSLISGGMSFAERGQNSLTGFDVLAVVVEIDTDTVVERLGGPLVAVAAETLAAGRLPIRLERVGRPEIKNVLLSPQEFDQVNRDIDLRDLYNLEDPFHLGKDYRGAYRARLDANLAAFDRIDGRVDWPSGADDHHPLTDLLLADHLVLDVAEPFAGRSYFEIEQAVLDGRPHATCGGRWLDDDVMDTIYTLIISAGNAPVGDGVDGPTVPASRTFPHLAPPNAGGPS
ncbi:MAG: DUF4331 family protein [Pseudonocardia sp.]